MAFSKLCTIGLGRSHRDGNMHVPFDISQGLCQFINCGVGNIVQAPFFGVQLEDSTIKDYCESESGSCSSSSNSDVDVKDGEISCVEKKAVKVNQVNLGSFAHGFGLRENDIIVTVNDKRVETAQMANFLVNKTIGIKNNRRLAMKIQRIERGFIKLDNQGDELEVEAIEDLICISCLVDQQQQKCRLKNLRYRKFLTVRKGNIYLSRRTTNEDKTYFVIYEYVKHIGESAGDRFIMLKHEASGKCLCVENKSELILKDPPQPITRLSENSAFLFNMKSSTNPDYVLPISFETIASPGMAIGFTKPRRKAKLLHDESDVKVLFNVFVV